MRRVLIIPSCGEVHDGLTEYLEHAQPWHARLGYRLHFLLCHACRGLLRVFRIFPGQVRRVMGPSPEAPPEAHAALEKILTDLGSRPRPGK